MTTGAERHIAEWVAYWAGASLALLVRYIAFIASNVGEVDEKTWATFRTRLGRGWKVWTLKWFVGRDSERSGGKSPVSWVTTIGIVWLVGSLVVTGAVDEYLPDPFGEAPVVALSFTIGTLMEIVAPPIAVALVAALSRLGGGK